VGLSWAEAHHGEVRATRLLYNLRSLGHCQRQPLPCRPPHESRHPRIGSRASPRPKPLGEAPSGARRLPRPAPGHPQFRPTGGCPTGGSADFCGEDSTGPAGSSAHPTSRSAGATRPAGTYPAGQAQPGSRLQLRSQRICFSLGLQLIHAADAWTGRRNRL
jgi:hypothetical protein